MISTDSILARDLARHHAREEAAERAAVLAACDTIDTVVEVLGDELGRRGVATLGDLHDAARAGHLTALLDEHGLDGDALERDCTWAAEAWGWEAHLAIPAPAPAPAEPFTEDDEERAAAYLFPPAFWQLALVRTPR